MDFKWDSQGFWGSFAKRAKEVLLEDEPLPQTNGEAPSADQEEKTKHDGPVLQKGLDVIASSLSRIGDTLGNAIEGSFNMIAADPKNRVTQPRILVKEEADLLTTSQEREANLDKQTQLKASRDVAMAMAAKVKLLLRELKTVKSNLTFMKERCSQLEEENKRLRESLEKGLRHEEDDLVRQQLETLVAEKSRLSQENANYARESQFLHEVIEYHRLTLQDVSLLDESIQEVAESVGDKPLSTGRDRLQQPILHE